MLNDMHRRSYYECAKWFIGDMASQIATRIQLTSDGHKAYLKAVEGAFGADVDYATLIKLYGNMPDSAKGRYSSGDCTGAKKAPIDALPIPSTSALHMRNVPISQCARTVAG